MLREVVLPTALVYAGVVIVLLAAVAFRPPTTRHGTVRTVIDTVLGGTATFMLAMTAYCSARGVAFGGCITEPLRGAVLLAVIAAVGFGAIEAIRRAVGR